MREIKRFVIIDDDVNNNYLCKYIIHTVARDMEVIEFITAEEGLAYFSGFTGVEGHTVLLLDLKMPVMDGWGFLERYMKLNNNITQHISVYIVSSSIDPADKLKSDQNEMVLGYVVKPLAKGTVQNIMTGLM